MAIMIHDEKVARAFSTATGPQQVKAADGQILGNFIPGSQPTMSMPEIGLTDEALLDLVNDPNAVWRSPEEVMARLREIDRCTL